MDLSAFETDNSCNCIVGSDIPEIAKRESCWLGIDEAGRGPVLGPMVYGTCYSPISLKDQLKEMGFADSKVLNEEQREKLFEKIKNSTEVLGWMIEVLSPNFISNSMLRRSKYNLNALSHDCAIGLIKKALDKGANIKEVYVDTVGDPAKYQAKLKGIFPDLDITVAKKADSIYPIVSAASICAKVARDNAVKNWTFKEGITVENFGSGYPGDPATKKFLTDYLDPVFGFPQFVRFSWSTADLLLQKNAVSVKWEDDDDDDQNDKKRKKDSAGTHSLFTFYKSEETGNKRSKKHSFFDERCLKNMTHF
ncbi:ribonuclease H2 subunit A isoform X1 [Lingula anatina]|uniref:Ribonuclease n=1 Tax=Lingula anatina TaxID=7574 RepID=A0A1S3K0B7_LINAN|nr:ribonuclease H2 subunit A isoform X1 [Lingula anatina]|eukprot:XP_013415716.1 ribonuclease H2 subunit A isoform X1 [Lingula anatina]